MRQLRITFFFLAVALTLGACGVFGGSDGADVSVADDVAAPATPNNVQPVPADASSQADGENPSVPADQGQAGAADGAVPTPLTLPSVPPTAEPTVDRSQPTTYIVQSGDVLGLIAERFDADIAELRSVNDLDGNLIQVGQQLTIPAADGSTTTDSDTSTESADPAPAAPAATSAPATTVSCNSAATGHCIQPGESLLGIALKYDVTVESLRAANAGISGDLIKSGEVLNLPGQTAASPTSVPATGDNPSPDLTPTTVAVALPRNDAECAASNAEYPYFHDFGDGRQGCYANPFGDTTPVPTVAGGESDVECPVNHILLDIGEGLLCYPFDGGVTQTPTPVPTGGATGSNLNYGRPPCRDGYVVLTGTNRCWPVAENTAPTTVTPTGTATTTGNTVACADPNFVEDARGNCFLTQAGVDANCEVIDNVAKCPA